MGKVTVGYRYWLGMHIGVCTGPVDAVLELRSGDRTFWSGNVTANASLAIDQPELHGGDEKEGGIQGTLDIEMGEPSQTPNGYLLQKHGANTPAYRGILGLVWRRGLLSANNPYIKPWAVKLRRITKGWNGGAPWYSAKAAITLPSGIGQGMNPAHIIYQCLTDPDWGMGYGSSLIDDADFRAAADTLHAEGFGLCMLWTQQQAIEAFLQTVLDHIGANLIQDRSSGLFKLKLLRADYTPASLPLFDESNIVAVDSYQRPALPDAVNEITVTYEDLATGKPSSVRVQNLANITAQGGVVTQSRQYPGLPTPELAHRVALRDLRAVSTAIARVRFRANRAGAALMPGDVIRWSWSKLGITSLVLRVLRVNSGTVADGTVDIEAAEDVFGLPANSYAAQQPVGWTEPATLPAAAANRMVREANYYEVLQQLGSVDTDALADDASFVVAAASRGAGDSIDFGLRVKLNSATAYEEQGRAPFAPTGQLQAAISPAVTSAVLVNMVDEDLVTAGGYAQVGAEIVRVDAFNASTGAITLGRGVCGTVAAAHSAGARMFFLDGFLGYDATERVDAEQVNVKLTPRTGRGELAEASAPVDNLTLDQVPARPYPPGRLRISGQAYPVTVTTPLSLSWSHRNRLQQNLEGDESGNIGPEPGTTYTAQVLNPTTGDVLRQQTGIATTSFTPATFYGNADVRVKLWSVRDGLASHQLHDYTFAYNYELPESIEGMHSIRQVGTHAYGVRAYNTPNAAVRPISGAGAIVGGGGVAYFSGQVTQIASTETELFVSYINGSSPSSVFRYTVSGPTLTLAGQYEAAMAADCFGVAVGGGFVWVAGAYSGTIKKLDPTTLAEIGSFGAPLSISTLDYDAATGSLFVCDLLNSRVMQINPSTGGTIRTFATGAFLRDLLVTPQGALFAVSDAGLQVFRVSDGVLLRTVAAVPSRGQWTRVLADIGSGEVVATAEDTIRYFDATTGADTRSSPFGAASLISGYGAGRLWVMVGGASNSTVGSTISRLLRASASLVTTSAEVGATAPGVTITAGASFIPGSASGVETDAYPTNTVLLLHADGTNGSTSFPDSSAYARAMTANGTAQISTAQSKFGGASAYFDGSGFVEGPDSDAWAFGTGDYTVECWIYATVMPTSAFYSPLGNWQSNSTGWCFFLGLSGTLYFNSGASGIASPSSSISTNTWHHIAYTRQGTTARLFIDGVQVAISSDLTNHTVTQAVCIGRNRVSGDTWRGYVDDVRVTKGVARYIANFTPPTGPLPNPEPYLGWETTPTNTTSSESGFKLTRSGGSDGTRPVRHTIGKTSGKFALRYLLKSAGGASDQGPGVGVLLGTTFGSFLGGNSSGVALWANSSGTAERSYKSGTPTSQGDLASFVADTEVMVEIDITAGKVWLGVNGTWIGGGNPAAGTGETYTLGAGTWYPACDMYYQGTVQLLKPSQFTTPASSGFTAGWPSA